MIFIFSTTKAYADIEGGIGRIRGCSTAGVPDGLDYSAVDGGDDFLFVMDNPICITVAVTTYSAVKASISAMNRICGSGSVMPRALPSPTNDLLDMARATRVAVGSRWDCAAALGTAASAYATALGILRVVYETAKVGYEGTKICGSEWYQPNTVNYTMDAGGYKQTVKMAVDGYIRTGNTAMQSMDNKTYREWYYDGVEITDDVSDMWGDVGQGLTDATNEVSNFAIDAVDTISDDNIPDTSISLTTDAENSICRDPTALADSSNVESVAYSSYPAQKYYLKGLAAGNYNCRKYDILEGQNDPTTNQVASAKRLLDFRKAYNCCKARSRDYVCLDFSGSRVFCKAGSRCTLKGITFEAKHIENDSLTCARSYSVCPYNFNIKGGTETCDYYQDGIWNSSEKRWHLITQEAVTSGNCTGLSEIREANCMYNSKAGRCKNYCQYLTHCTVSEGSDYHYSTDIGSPYFSDACINFTGDSLNRTAYGTGFLLGSQRHFSAPIAQCVKETLENVFYNRAGHSKCATTNEVPSANGTCASGRYMVDGTFIYKKGNTVSEKSFFSTIQNRLQGAVKVVLTLSIMFYGMNILLGKNDIRDKKDIVVYLAKIALIMYFATGDAWQTMFFDGVYGASAEFSRMVFKIQADESELKRDGCQFGKISLADGTQVSSGRTYPHGKEYLALWDTLDCKIARYLGFGPEVSAANIAKLILAGYLTGPIGIYFATSVMFFGILFIALTLRALHIFLSSAISIIIMVFISPIVIPTMLFAKTADIFKNWLTNLISFCLQPMILFAYIAILIMVIDKTMIGSATFHGPGPFKALSCRPICQGADGTIIDETTTEVACDRPGQEVIDPLDDSVACLINVNSFGSFPGLELIGVSIPIIVNLFDHNAKQRVLNVVKATLVMFLLCKFIDEIPGITTTLIGGAALPSASVGAKDMMNKVNGFLKGVQQRGMGAGRKAGGKIRDKMSGSMKGGTDRGKKSGGSGGGSGAHTGGDEGGSKTGGGGNDGGKTGSESGGQTGGGGSGGQTGGGGDGPPGTNPGGY